MSVDYIVASLPALRFDEVPALSWEDFVARTGFAEGAEWRELETQLRNAVAEARTGSAEFARATKGLSLYWKNRVLACFAEKDVMRREELLDRVWWDAAGELTPPASPLGAGALATYAVRLRVALKRAKISVENGNQIFEKAINHD